MPDLAANPHTQPSQCTPLSESSLWEDVREFYAKAGTEGWGTTVPFDITSNPQIGDGYAHLVLRFVQDVVASSRFAANEPFYVIELGAGSGKFGFHLIRRLAELRPALGLDGVDIVHVMTDVTGASIEHWRRHPRLRSFLERGLLAIGRFDVERDGALHLLAPDGRPGAIEVSRFANPPVVIANYVFDSVSQDVFRMADGRLEEMLVELVTVDGESGADAHPRRRAVWSTRVAPIPRYADPDAAALLSETAAAAAGEPVLFPIGALGCMRRLAGAADGRLALLASDLGPSRPLALPEIELEIGPALFYLPVDLAVVASFLKRVSCASEFHRHFRTRALDTLVSVIGFEAAELPETRQAIELYVERLGPSGRAAIDTLLKVAGAALSLEGWLAVAALLRYDSRLLDSSVALVLNWVRSGDADHLRDDLLDALDRIASAVYWLPGAPDTYFNVGMVLHEMGEIDRAIAFYRESLEVVGPTAETLYDIGLCEHLAGRSDAALDWLRRALELEPKHILARGWAAQIALDADDGRLRTATKHERRD